MRHSENSIVGVVALAVLALAGCSATIEAPTANCEAAFDAASAGIETLYATHPFYGSEYDQLYADGEISDTEQEQLDVMMADEQAQYGALVGPTYDACNGVADAYRGAYSQGENADWNLQGNEAISTEELERIFVTSYCYGFEVRPACAGFDPADWEK